MTFTDALEEIAVKGYGLRIVKDQKFIDGAKWARRYTLTDDVVKGMADTLRELKELMIFKYAPDDKGIGAKLAAYDQAVRELGE